MSRVRKDGHHGCKPRKVGTAADGRTIWECRVRCGLRRDGKPKERSERFTGTYQEAVDHTDHMWRIYNAMPDELGRITLREYYEDHFRPEHLDRGPVATKRSYESAWNIHIAPFFANRYPQDISHNEIQQWIYSMKPPTDRRVYRHFKAIVRAMYDEDYMGDIMPLTKKVRYGRYQKQRKDVWSAEELLEASNRIRGHHLERLFLVMAGGGLRREEAVALVVPDDLEFVERADGSTVCYIEVRKAATDDDGLKDEKTYSPYTVAILPPFSERLRELMPEDPEPIVVNPRQYPNLPINNPRIYPRCTKQSALPGSIARQWTALFNESHESVRHYKGKETSRKTMPAGPLHGMRYIPLNNLRHTHVTLTLQGGVNASISAMAHGHQEAVEYRHYLSDRGTADQVAAAFSSHFSDGKTS